MEALIFVKKTIGADYVGTVKANNKSLPKEAIFPKVGRGKKQRGDSKQMRVKLKNSNDYAYFVAWQDNKPVHILSTLRSYLTAVQRNGYDDARQWVRRTYSIPTVISQYNKICRITDRSWNNLRLLQSVQERNGNIATPDWRVCTHPCSASKKPRKTEIWLEEGVNCIPLELPINAYNAMCIYASKR